MNKLAGKVAIVTGASKGIGVAIAKDLAAAGASVVVNYASSKEGADRTVAEIVSKGGKAIAVQADVAIKADVKRMFKETERAFGKPNVLVNNAAAFVFEPFEAVTEAEFHREFNANVLGPVLTIQEALKYFPQQGGSIINIGSIVSDNPSPFTSLYSATKGAMATLSKALASELGPRKIRVNTVSPGITVTEGAHRVGFIGSEWEKVTIASTPLGRLGLPEDISPVVVFLASDDSAWLTGAQISASGGLR